MKKIKIIFFGSKFYSSPILKILKKDKKIEIIRIIEDKNSLTGFKSLKEQPDVAILAAFGAILPKEILNLPQKGILNIHPSLLPQYRGPSPVQTAILNGDKQVGVTIIKMDEEIDHGPILTQTKEEIKGDDTAQSLYLRLFTIGAEILTTILPAYIEDKIELRQQDHSQATYTKKLTRNDGKIDWKQSNQYLERFIRAMFPWPEAWTDIKIDNQKKKLKITKAHLENKKLILDQVQLEGKNLVSFKQFKEGYPQAKIIK